MIALIFLVCCLILATGYKLYGGFLSKQLEIDPNRQTPACSMNDGVDYVPAKIPMLFGHHFSSIAGAGPIAGAVIASTWFGWGPTILWILVGAIFIGGMHDFGTLIASCRHKAGSIAEISRLYLNPFSYRSLLIFVLWRRGENPTYLFAFIPMIFMFITPLTGMMLLIVRHLDPSNTAAVKPVGWLNAAMLALTLTVNVIIIWRDKAYVKKCLAI